MVNTQCKRKRILRVTAIGVCLLVWRGTTAQAEDVGTAFTYQGSLNKDGQPLNDSADFLFTLWDADREGNQIGPRVAKNNVNVVDGLFTSLLDFGSIPYANNEGRWLEIAVRHPAGQGQFQTLTPR